MAAIDLKPPHVDSRYERRRGEIVYVNQSPPARSHHPALAALADPAAANAGGIPHEMILRSIPSRGVGARLPWRAKPRRRRKGRSWPHIDAETALETSLSG
jgi:hypothetical protein